MRQAIIQTLTSADPGFVKILERIPDSDPSIEPHIIESLPKLQELYIRKREAFKKRDMAEFQRVLNEEIDFVRDLGQIAFHS